MNFEEMLLHFQAQANAAAAGDQVPLCHTAHPYIEPESPNAPRDLHIHTNRDRLIEEDC